MNTSNFLEDLKRQKQLLVDELKYIGIETSENKLFNDLIPEVLNISEGRQIKTGLSYPTQSETTFVPNISFDVGFEPEKLYVFSEEVYKEAATNVDGSPTYIYALNYDIDVPTEKDYALYIFGRHDKKMDTVDDMGLRSLHTKKNNLNGVISYSNGIMSITLKQSWFGFNEITFKPDKTYKFIAVGKQSVTSTPSIYDITADGVISLKHEYRGASLDLTSTSQSFDTYAKSDNGFGIIGSMNKELPPFLVIPSSVNDITVTALAPCMFHANDKVEVVILPSSITAIPDYCFYKSTSLRLLLNTSQIQTIGVNGITDCRVKNLDFPNLSDNGLSTYSFRGLTKLETLNIGNTITSIPDYSMAKCISLKTIFGGNSVTSISHSSLFGTHSLNDVGGILTNVTNIEKTAFYDTGYGGNTWDTIVSNLNNCQFGDYATPYHQGNYEEWLTHQSGDLSPITNPIAINFCQDNPKWANMRLGEEINSYIDVHGLTERQKINVTSTSVKYNSACGFWAFFGAYCGIKIKNGSSVTDYTFNNPIELMIKMWEDALLLNKESEFKSAVENYSIGKLMEAMQTPHTEYYHCEQEDINAFYEALLSGKYIQVKTHTSVLDVQDKPTHSVLLYGVTSDGKVLVANTSSFNVYVKEYTFETRECYPQNLMIDLPTPDTIPSGQEFKYRLFSIIG